HKRLGQRLSHHSIEDVTFDLGTILARYRHVSAVIKSLFQRFAQLFLCGQLRYPALQGLMLRTRRHFQFIGMQNMFRAVRMARSGHARVSSSLLVLFSIFTSGLYECTGVTGSFSNSSAPSSALRV